MSTEDTRANWALPPPAGRPMEDEIPAPSASSERCHGDLKLRDYLAERDFRGPEYDMFEREIAAYGIATVTALIRTKKIVEEMSKKGLLGSRKLSRDSFRYWPREHEVDDIAVETVRRALPRFRQKALVEGGWRPTGGAALTTYFVGTCIVVFPDVYRPWMREQMRHQLVDLTDQDPSGVDGAINIDPLEILVRRENLRDLLPEDARTREIVLLFTDGYSHAEIAEITGITVRAVEGVLYRFRVKTGRLLPGRGSR
jgi:DNA-directed RNA polymerase specialized sigma24 family protein